MKRAIAANGPTPDPSQEGNCRGAPQPLLPSWEGSWVGLHRRSVRFGRRDLARFSVGALACAALLAIGADRIGYAQVQPSSAGTASRFNTSEYFDPPHQSQMKYQLTGAEARQEGSGRLRLTQMKLQTFLEDGTRQIVVEAPECVYESSKRVASSAGPLQVQTGDGRFFVEGEGFLWQAGESVLTISNQVRSLLQRLATNSPAAEAKPPLVITSRQFEFDIPKRQGVYREQVHGDDPEMEFTSGFLTASASTNAQSFDLLVAETEVAIISKLDGRSAHGDRGVYTRSDESMELIGHAAWKQERQEGRADRAVIRRLERSFEAKGNVALKLPRESLGLSGFFLAGTKTNPPPALPRRGESPVAADSSPLVDLFADQFQSRSNLTIAEGAVRVMDATNQLSCDKLTVQSATAASPEETAIAEGNVVVSQGEQGHRIRSQRAVYTKSDEMIVFTERPEWNLDQSEGHADRVTIHNPTGDIHAEGSVAAKITLPPQQGSFLTFFPNTAKTSSAPQVIEVFARELNAKDRFVTFLGEANAHQSPITGSEPRLRSDALVVRFGTNVHQVESIAARANVVYEQGIPGVAEGTNVYRKLITRTLTARSDSPTGALSSLLAEGDVQIEQPGNIAKGERVTYTTATDLLELTGSPTLQTPQVTITDARTLVWDKANNGFSATAPYKIKLRLETIKKVRQKPKP
jgi:lipopolysaccharide export system protein LptA